MKPVVEPECAPKTSGDPGRRLRVGLLVTVALVVAGPGNAQQPERQRARIGARYVGSGPLPSSAVSRARQELDYELSVAGRRMLLPSGVQEGTIREGEPVIVQFESPPDEVTRDRLRRRGFRFLELISDTAYWVRAEGPASLQGIPGLRSGTRPTPDLKIGPQLGRALAAREPGVTITVQVGFFDDVPGSGARDALAGVGVDAERPLVDGRVVLRADRVQIAALASHPFVRALELGGIGRRTHNLNNIELVRANEPRKRFGLTGAGVHLGLWDAGPVDVDHTEFAGRVGVVDEGEPLLHPTHVAGTIAARGAFSFAGGFGPEALVHSYDFDGDVIAEMHSAIEEFGVVISSNPWGLLAGWEYAGRFYLGGPIMSWFGDENFGRYTIESRLLDEIVHDDGLTVVFAAGNHRNDAVRAAAYYDEVEERVVRRDVEERDGPYTSIDPFASAKNVLTVGATAGTSHMAPFSSWGPTRDGRIKPEVTAPGLGVFSTLPGDDYGVESGTSMSAATVSGALALLVELWRRGHRGNDPPPAVLRNVLIATALDPADPGPDYEFGYGTIDVAAAADLLRGNRRVLIQRAIEAGERQTFDLRIRNEVERLRVTLSWLDPKGPELVNDLDVAVVPRGGNAILPWRLDPRQPERSASRGVNGVDNIEVVDVEDLPVGRAGRRGWQIEVSAPRLGSGSAQEYVLTIVER